MKWRPAQSRWAVQLDATSVGGIWLSPHGPSRRKIPQDGQNVEHRMICAARAVLIVIATGLASQVALADPGVATTGDLLDFERADVRVFREEFVAADRSFTQGTRALAEKRLLQIEH